MGFVEYLVYVRKASVTYPCAVISVFFPVTSSHTHAIAS